MAHVVSEAVCGRAQAVGTQHRGVGNGAQGEDHLKT